MNHIASSQLSQLVDCMYSIEFTADEMIITEGDYGSLVYVLGGMSNVFLCNILVICIIMLYLLYILSSILLYCSVKINLYR
ncbi:unnamed protein product [Schistosoma mattheei]|uniref:Uncharacterized protein n=1 Tax=Schistosoma mattheei TaxID=31246 RepID=A0A183Q3M9_9TREM|nr:unnamed protein product [Schistosoma mattheei]